MIKWLTIIGLSSIAFAPLANAQNSFHFNNGASVLFSPTSGVWFKAANAAGYVHFMSEPVRMFESTGGTVAPNQSFGTFIDGSNNSAYFKPAKSASITFFKTTSGLYVLSETGHWVFIKKSETLNINGFYYFEPQPEIQSSSGRLFRSIGVRIGGANNTTTVQLIAFNKQLKQMNVTLNGLADHNAYVKYIFEVQRGLESPDVMHLEIQAEDRHNGGRIFESEWAMEDAEARIQELARDRSLAKHLTDFTHYTPLNLEGELEEEGFVREHLGEMLRESKSTGKATRWLIQEEYVPWIIKFVNSQILHGRINGIVEYHPIQSAQNEVVDKWIDESLKLKELTRTHSYFILVRQRGRAHLVFHPRGSGAELQNTTSGCSLLL